MKQLIKQIFKSLKTSLLLVLSLIFLSFCIIFVSSSSLFINQNLNNSVTHLRTDGNSADVVVEKKYNSSDIQYTHSTPHPKKIRVSNYFFNKGSTINQTYLQNIIFPYQSTDYSDPSVNEQWILKPGETAPAYYDINLPRYGNRKLGLLKGGVVPQNQISPTAPNWYGMGYSMTDRWTGAKFFDPKYFIFDSTLIGNQANLVGYFNEGSITNEITLAESQLSTNQKNFTYATNQGIATLPLVIIHQNVIWHYKLDLNPFLNDYGYYYGNLLTSLRSNTSEVTSNAWTLNLDSTSLKGIDLFVYNEMQKMIANNPTLFEDYKKTISEEFVIREEWIEEYIINSGGTVPPTGTPPTPEQIKQRNKIIQSFLTNRKKQLTNKFKLFVDNNKDLFIQNHLTQLGYENDGDSSITFYDRETNNSFLVARKENNIINKIVLNNGTALSNSSEYQSLYSSIHGKLLSIVGYNNIDKKSMDEGLKSLVNLFSKVISTFNIEANLASELENLSNGIVEMMTNNPTDVKLKWMLRKLFAYLSEPVFSPNNFQNAKIIVNWKGNSSILNDRGFDVTLPILDNYGAIVTQSFIDNNSNKQILPQSGTDTNNWEYAKRLSAKDFNTWFNNLDAKYTIKVGIDKLIIKGTGLSPEMAYPVIDLAKPVPDPKNNILVYVNDATYNFIWSHSGKPFKHKYFALKHNIDPIHMDSFIDKLNTNLMPIMNDSSYFVASRLDTFLTNNILSIRYSFPSILSDSILISSISFVVILSLLAIYLFYIVLKKYIDINKTQLAIIKANGLSTLKMSICFSVIALIIAVFSGLIGYLLSYFLQPFIFLIFIPYVFISPIFNSFSIISFLGGILLIFFIAMLFVWINLHLLFKKPLNSIMSQNIEVKYNVFLSILKYKNMKISSGNKFRIALFMSNSTRTLFYIFGCITGITLITMSLSLTSKFYTSKNLTDINKNYIYNIDLVSPIDQAGLYKTQNYSDLGTTNEEIGISSLYEQQPGVFPYTLNQMKVYEITGIDSLDNIVSKRPKLDYKGNQIYFGNIALPSLQIYNYILTNPDSLRNAVMVKWLLDFDIRIPILGISINAWDRVKVLLAPEIASKISAQDVSFKEKLITTPGIGKLFKSFSKINPLTNEYSLDGDKIINYSTLILDQKFLDFLGLVYGDENLSNADSKVSWSTIPINHTTTETYTYVDADISIGNQNGKSKVFGINPFSKYMNLKNNNREFIGDKLDSLDNNVIINNGAALKYNLSIGDKVNFKVNNSYFRYTNKMMGLEGFIQDEFTFNVVDICSTSFGEEFFISQANANKITYLDKGTFISKITPTTVGGNVFTTRSIPYETDRLNYNYYVPYNGFLCNTNDPIYLSKTLSFYSLVNLYGQVNKFSFKNEELVYMMSTLAPNYIAESFITKSEWIIDQYNILNQSNNNTITPITRDIYKNDLLKANNDYQALMNYIINYFGQEDVMLLTLNSILNYNTSQIIYTTLIGTLDTIQVLVMSLIIPIVVLIIFIMSSVMLNEMKMMLSVFKTLGYSDKQNISNIISTFFPIFIIAILLSLGVLAIILIGFQNVIYYFLSVYISSSIGFLQFLYAALAIFLVLVLNILFTIYSYKRSKLNTSLNT